MILAMVLYAGDSCVRIGAAPVHHISEPHYVIGTVVDIAQWWRAPGVAPVLFAILHRRPDDLRVELAAAATCDLKLSLSSIHTSNALILSFAAIWESYHTTPFLSWLCCLCPVAAQRCIISALAGANLTLRGIAL